MKQYTHAWIAFKAIQRLTKVAYDDPNKKPADGLRNWFMSHKDGVIQGAWYPDAIIKDNATSHIKKFTPSQDGQGMFGSLPDNSLIYALGKRTALYQKGYTMDPGTNLPERCEALSHSFIDNMRVQQAESKGSPIAPTDNHIALILFMLSHYIADGHMPFHCDSRKFSQGVGLHAIIEGVWEEEVASYYDIDLPSERFFYDKDGYPLLKVTPADAAYTASILKRVEDQLNGREFVPDTYGSGNNVREYMLTVCQYSYLVAYGFIPQGYDETNVTADNYRTLQDKISFDDLSIASLSDAVDAVARVWLRVWRRYVQWTKDTGQKKPTN